MMCIFIGWYNIPCMQLFTKQKYHYFITCYKVATSIYIIICLHEISYVQVYSATIYHVANYT